MFIDSFSFRTPGGAVPWRRLAAGIVAAFAMGAIERIDRAAALSTLAAQDGELLS